MSVMKRILETPALRRKYIQIELKKKKKQVDKK